MINGFDCYGPQTLATYEQFKKKGYTFVGRYYTHAGSVKLLTKQDAENISRAGLQIAAVFETDPTNAGYFSYDKGKNDLLEAAVRAVDVGQPNGTAIHFAVDYDAGTAEFPTIGNYFKGICDEMKNFTLNDKNKRSWKIGVYGSFPVVYYVSHNVKGVEYIWQTYAWSKGKIISNYNIYQYSNDISELGIKIDHDRGNDLRAFGIGGFKV
jgi:hypothetical protein